MQTYWNKGNFLDKKEFNSHRTGFDHQHGRYFIVLEQQYGRRDVMWKRSIYNIADIPSTNSQPFCIWSHLSQQ